MKTGKKIDTWCDEKWEESKSWYTHPIYAIHQLYSEQIDRVFDFQLETNNTTKCPMWRIAPSREAFKKHLSKHQRIDLSLMNDNLMVFVILPNDEKGWYTFETKDNFIKIKQYGKDRVAWIEPQYLRVDTMDEFERMRMILGEDNEE